MPLTFDDVARFPRPGMSAPGRLAWSPDGRWITFLESADGSLSRELYRVDVATGERARIVGLEDIGGGATDGNVSAAEALRRERERLREVGITHYAWASQAMVLLVPVRGTLWVGPPGALRPLAHGAEEARLSADGARLVFARQGELWSVPTAPAAGAPAGALAGAPVRLTAEAGIGVFCGSAEYIAQEEMHRMEGFWISPRGRQIAFTRVDERHIPALHIPHPARAPGAEEIHRYPFTGAANAKVSLGVVPMDGGAVQWIDIGPFEYLCRVQWQDEHTLLVQVQPRDQRTLELRRIDLLRGAARTLLTETSPAWVNLHNSLTIFPAGAAGPLSGGFLWLSERTGFQHIYRFDADGYLIAPLTSGPWMVDRIVRLGRDSVLFTGTLDSPLERHLYRVPLSGGPPERLTSGAGLHDVIPDRVIPDRESAAFLDFHDSRTSPPSISLCRPGQPPLLLHPDPLRAPALKIDGERPDLPPPEILSIPSRHGHTLYGALFLPAGAGPFPLIVSVYGGPHVQAVQESWALTVDLRAQYLREQGFAVLKLDNRGSARRGLAFESAIHLRTGHAEVEDQVDGVRWLVRQGIADAARVGVYGWSYGGYMALMCLCLAPEVFRAGVAGAPVTEWEGYDTHYTERYMGMPADNPGGYRDASVLTWADRIRGDLLIVHGMIDENVHFRHAARLVDRLLKAGVPHTLIAFPDERHMPRGEQDRRALEARICGFLMERLRAGA